VSSTRRHLEDRAVASPPRRLTSRRGAALLEANGFTARTSLPLQPLPSLRLRRAREDLEAGLDGDAMQVHTTAASRGRTRASRRPCSTPDAREPDRRPDSSGRTAVGGAPRRRRARGCRVYVIAPAVPNAPRRLPQLSRTPNLQRFLESKRSRRRSSAAGGCTPALHAPSGRREWAKLARCVRPSSATRSSRDFPPEDFYAASAIGTASVRGLRAPGVPERPGPPQAARRHSSRHARRARRPRARPAHQQSSRAVTFIAQEGVAFARGWRAGRDLHLFAPTRGVPRLPADARERACCNDGRLPTRTPGMMTDGESLQGAPGRGRCGPSRMCAHRLTLAREPGGLDRSSPYKQCRAGRS